MTAFSYQLYSSRNFGPLSQTLANLGKLGYSQAEGYGALFADLTALDVLKTDLAAAGLLMASGHFSLDMVENNPARVLEIAATLGTKSIYVPYLLPEDRPTDAAGWRAFGARLQAASAPFTAAGLTFGWHNHDFEFVALPTGEIPMALILDGNPDVTWEIDVAWVVCGGHDPLEWIQKYANQITAAHIKDIAPTGENTDEDGWADVGHGTMDCKAIMTALRSTNAALFIMEHDNPSDDMRFAKNAITSANSF